MIRKIIRGSKEDFTFNLGIKQESGITKAFDLTGILASNMFVCFKVGDQQVDKTDTDITIDSAPDGKISVTLSVADTTTFEAGKLGDIEVKIDADGAGDVTRFQELESFKVVEKICT